MGRHAAPLPGQFAWAPFRVADASERDIGPGRLRGRDLMRPVRGVRAPADADLHTRCRALLLHRPHGMWFSHLTAARLYEIPLPSRLRYDDRIHLSVAAPSRAPQIAGTTGHVAARSESAVHRGLPVSQPAANWLELAASLHREELVVAADFLVGASLTTIERLTSIVEEARGRRGVGAARLAVALVRPGSESPAESALRVLLHDAGIAPPELNYRIHAHDGSFVARVDMAYPDQRLILEYEGDHHRVDREQWHKDIRRQAQLEDLGWRVIRVTASDLTSPAALIARILRALATSRE